MRYERGTKALTIIEDEKDREAFDAKLNEFLTYIHDDAKVQFHNLQGKLAVTVIGKYSREIPENIKDEYELAGDTHYCGECRFYQPILLENGKPDKRFRHGLCNHSAESPCIDSRSCEFFYTMLDAGKNIFKEGGYEY